MNSPHFHIRVTAIAIAVSSLVALVAAGASAQVAAVGDRLPERRFEDQFGMDRDLDARVRVVLFARDMEAGDALKAGLADQSGEELTRQGIAYVSDISGMPAVVARLFAIPALRGRSYSVWLDRDGSLTTDLPSEAGKATVLRLEDLKVTEVGFVGSAAELRSALGLEAPEAAP